MAYILARSARMRRRYNLRAIVLGCVMSAAMIGTAAAFGTRIVDGVRVWLSGNSGVIVVHSFAMVRDPRSSDLRSVLAKATFPVVLPVGLPAGMHMGNLIYAPADHPNIVVIQYQSDRTPWRIGFTLIDIAAINSGPPPIPGMPVKPDRWNVGRETVLVARNALSPNLMTRIKAAMLSSSVLGAFDATSPTLYRAMVLGAERDLGQIARQYEPSTGETVVLGPFFANSIPSLARRGKPLIGSNTTYLTNIPSENGAPNYAKATLQWPRMIALPAEGTRAVAAALRYSRSTGPCDCALVVNTADGARYRVWVIRPGAPARAYRVDARTLIVTAAR
jgi:hypothetical protein